MHKLGHFPAYSKVPSCTSVLTQSRRGYMNKGAYALPRVFSSIPKGTLMYRCSEVKIGFMYEGVFA